MSTPREPNPLRPYYTPPSIGEATTLGYADLGAASTSTSRSFGSSARNILADIDYADYVSDTSSGAQDAFKSLLENMLWRYSSIFLAQPFEVAKIVLQVQLDSGRQKQTDSASLDEQHREYRTRRHDAYESESSDSDPDFPSYFTSSTPLSNTPTRPSRSRRRHPSSSTDGVPRVHRPRSPPRKPPSPHQLDLKSSSSIFSTLSTVWNAEGAWGIWKGTNCTFVHSILHSTITSFARSFLSALFALPDPGLSLASATSGLDTYAGGLDILNSPYPLSSLLVAVSAAAVAGTILAPLDMARTKLILTPCTHLPRSIISTLKSLPQWTLPISIAPTTILHSALPTFISTSTPLVLRSKLGIDPVLTPNIYSIATFCSQAVDLGLRIPLETVLRRGQLALARGDTKAKLFDVVVDAGPYKGLFGTMRSIVYEEGEREVTLTKGEKGREGAKATKVGQQRRRGQGTEGLYRGWRVGMWGLVGVWGAATLGGIGAKGGEF